MVMLLQDENLQILSVNDGMGNWRITKLVEVNAENLIERR